MSFSFLPFPSSFKPYLRYSLEDDLPFWICNCFENQEKKKYFNLFDEDLAIKKIDESSLKAINEFAFNSIDQKKLILNFSFSKNEDVLFDDLEINQALLNALKRNSLKKLSDLKFIQKGKNVSLKKIDGLGPKKLFELILLVSKSVANNPELPKAIDLNSSRDEALKLIRNNKNIPFESFMFNDPRFLDLQNIIYEYLRHDLDDDINWLEIFNISSSLVPFNKFKITFDKFVNIVKENETSSLEEQLIFLCKSINRNNVLNEKYFEGILNRLGIKESKNKIPTLQDIGSELNVSRERIRQVEARFLSEKKRYFDNNQIYIEKLNKIISFLEKNIFYKVKDVEKELIRSNLGEWSLERLLLVLNFLNIPNNYNFHKGILGKEGKESDVDSITKIIKKIVSYNGLVELNHLKETLNKNELISDEAIVKRVLKSFTELSPNWYYAETKINLLESIADRISNFSKKISIQDIKEGHVKHATSRSADFSSDPDRTGFYGFLTPNTEAIEAYFELNNNFRLEENMVIPLTENGKKYVQDPTSADSIFLNYFRARDFSTVTDQELKKYFTELGISLNSLYIYMTYKPYLKRFGRQVWGVAGYPPTEQERDNTKNRIEHLDPPRLEWKEEGIIEIKAQINNIDSYVFSIKNDFARFISTEEFFIKFGNEVYCKIKKSENFWYGTGKYLKNILHCNLGDHISIKLNLTSNEAFVSKISTSEYFE